MTGPLSPQGGDRLPAVAVESHWPSAPSRASLWRMISRNRLLVAACTALLVATTAIVTWRITPRYEASASIRIDPDDSRLLDLGAPRDARPNELATEFQVLQSRQLLGAVVDSLGLQLDLQSRGKVRRADVFRRISTSREAQPALYRLEVQGNGKLVVRDRSTGDSLGVAVPGRAIDLQGLAVELASRKQVMRALAAAGGRLDFDVSSFDVTIERTQASLRVRRRPEANVLDLRYEGTEPHLVQAVPNVLAARFISARQSERRAQARSTARFLREQIDKLSSSLRTAENGLRAFRERAGVVSLPDEASSGLLRLGELQARRSALDAERAALARLVQEVQHSTGADSSNGMASRSLVAFPTLLQNDAASQLLASLAGVEDRRSDLLSRRSLRDPEVQALTARAEQLSQQLRELALTYLQGLTHQVTALDNVLGRSRAQLALIPSKELEFTRRQREAQGLERVVTQLQSRLKEAEIAEAVEDPSVRLVDAAVLPRTPSSPNRVLNVVLALVFGLGLGAAGAFLREYIDRTARSRDDVRVATGVPVLGLLPFARSRALRARRTSAPEPQLCRPAASGGPWAVRASYSLFPVPGGAEPPSGQQSDEPSEGETRRSESEPAEPRRPRAPARRPGARPRRDVPALLIGPGSELFPSREGYNQLATNIAFSRRSGSPQVLVVTSPLPAEGKTTVAVNLAVTLAQGGAKVLLIDADLRRGAIASVLGARLEPGLAEVLLGSVPAGEGVQEVTLSEGRRLHLISRGRAILNPPAVLGGELASLLGSLRGRYNSIILDTPPVNIVADAKMIGAHGDAVIVVARAGVTTIEALAFANEELRSVGAPLLGTVLNSIDFRRDVSYDEAYRYYASSEAYGQEPR